MTPSYFSVMPSTGFVYVTDFVFTDITNYGAPIANRFWGFGDGVVVYNEQTVVHTYRYPGTYAVSLTATDIHGNIFNSSRNIIVEYAIRDAIRVVSVPEDFSLPGLPTAETFKLSVTSAQIDQPLNIQLHSANSRSVPCHLVDEKWRHLTPTWRFTDKNLNLVTTLSVEPTPLYQDNKQIGVCGDAEFYYIDDIGTELIDGDCSLSLYATLLTNSFIFPQDSNNYSFQSFANTSNVRSSILWQIEKVVPEYLRITSNLIDEVHPTRWVNAKIPILISTHNKKIVKNDHYGVVFAYPTTNESGKRSAVRLHIEGLQTNEYIVEDPVLSFQAYDNNRLPIGGFIYTTVTPLVTANRARITGYTYAIQNGNVPEKFLIPVDYPVPQHAWISNTEHNILDRITLLGSVASETGKEHDGCSETEITLNTIDAGFVDGSTITTYVPYISSTSLINYNLTGVSGAFGLAITPVTLDLIVADSETDAIYKYTTKGTLISAIQLKTVSDQLIVTKLPLTALPTKQTYIYYDNEVNLMPSYISIDRNNNFWVTLYNSVSVLKFSENFELLTAAVPGNTDYTVVTDEEKLFKPPVVETDRTNDIWVTYSQSLCSAIFKYDSDGNHLTSINLPPSSLPVGLAITPQNYVWVTNTMHESVEYGSIQCYRTDGTLLASVTGFGRPGYIALDRDANVWFTHGVRNIGFINSHTLATSSWLVSSTPTNSTFIPLQIPDPSFALNAYNDEELGGLAVDGLNRVWVIDSLYNNVSIISATPVAATKNDLRLIKIIPDSMLSYMPDIRTSFTIKLRNKRFKSAQATGDWTGNRWLQKYGDIQYFDGKSGYFSIYDFNENFRVKKVNEDFNVSEQYHSLALPEHLYDNTVLFENFFGAVAGNAQVSNFEDIGEKIYERIANFTQNHADIETCTVEQLISLCNTVDLSVEEYTASYPADIKLALDLFSTPKERVRGNQDVAPILSKSVGAILDTETSYITAGQNIFLQNKFSSIYTLIVVPVLSGQTVYPLKDIDGTGFAQPVINNYVFYDYAPFLPVNEDTGKPIFIENVVDWSNGLTTFNFNISSKDDWYGDNGFVEKYFNYLLTKNVTKGN